MSRFIEAWFGLHDATESLNPLLFAYLSYQPFLSPSPLTPLSTRPFFSLPPKSPLPKKAKTMKMVLI